MKTYVMILDVKIPEDYTDFEGEVYADVIEWIEEIADEDPELALKLLQGPFEAAVEAYWAEVFGEDDVMETEDELFEEGYEGDFDEIESGADIGTLELSALYDATEYVLKDLIAEVVQLNFDYDMTELALDSALEAGETEYAAEMQLQLDQIVNDYLRTEQLLFNVRNEALNISKRDRNRRQAAAA